ncbi:hypothetical protein JW835_14460 [bacterium]|nr:hypothetical protein [bacterium]
MKIIQLTQSNSDKYGYGCMMRGNIYVRHPQPYRKSMLSGLKDHVGRDVFNFVAVEEEKPAGHLLMGTVHALGIPILVQPDAPVILCTYVKRGYGKKGIGRSLIDAVRSAFPDIPGLLILCTKSRMYMPFQQFERFGFKMIHSHDFWKIGYLPVKRENVHVKFYEPELEWDYVKPFTLIRGGYCPFMLHVWQIQKKAAESFKQYAPVKEMNLEEARAKASNVTPGFYVFGKMAPAKPMFGWQFKRYIRKAIRKEEKKTFGAAMPTEYKKRKSG